MSSRGEYFWSDGVRVPGRRDDPAAQALLRNYLARRDAPIGTVLRSEDGMVIATKRDIPDDHPSAKPWELTFDDGDFITYRNHWGVADFD